MSVHKMQVGSSAVIDYIQGNNDFTRRLLALGCTEGTKITLKKIAPLGDPMVINFRGFDIALRKQEAKFIKIK
ncbi:FeoA family protein [Paraclostridium bifermentans]|uniref:FeoA family protein n=1 Tax=Paraclostridium bifermentans TaxID=1490 RepID=UPI00359C6C46